MYFKSFSVIMGLKESKEKNVLTGKERKINRLRERKERKSKYLLRFIVVQRMNEWWYYTSHTDRTDNRPILNRIKSYINPNDPDAFSYLSIWSRIGSVTEDAMDATFTRWDWHQTDIKPNGWDDISYPSVWRPLGGVTVGLMDVTFTRRGLSV